MYLGSLKIGRAEVVAAVGLVAYTFGRYLAAEGTMTQYGVDARWFLFWDAAPIPLYVWSIGQLVRGLAAESSRLRTMVGAATVAIVAFMSPYIYLFYAGATEFPLTAWLILLLVIALLGANAVRDIRKRVRERHEASTDIEDSRVRETRSAGG